MKKNHDKCSNIRGIWSWCTTFWEIALKRDICSKDFFREISGVVSLLSMSPSSFPLLWKNLGSTLISSSCSSPESAGSSASGKPQGRPTADRGAQNARLVWSELKFLITSKALVLFWHLCFHYFRCGFKTDEQNGARRRNVGVIARSWPSTASMEQWYDTHYPFPLIWHPTRPHGYSACTRKQR